MNDYLAFYQLLNEPFRLTPDPDYFYLSQPSLKPAEKFRQCFLDNKMALIAGDSGTGKSLYLHFLHQQEVSHKPVALVLNCDVPFSQLLDQLQAQFSLSNNAKTNEQKLSQLAKFAKQQSDWEKRPILLLDEADRLSESVLSGLPKLLTNDDHNSPLFSLVLAAGQNPNDKTQDPRLTPYIGYKLKLKALSKKQTKAYIRHRLQVAGSNHLDIFNESALQSIHEFTNGIPRSINRLCSKALLDGYLSDHKHIDSKFIHSVANELGLRLPEQAEQLDNPAQIALKESRLDDVLDRAISDTISSAPPAQVANETAAAVDAQIESEQVLKSSNVAQQERSSYPNNRTGFIKSALDWLQTQNKIMLGASASLLVILILGTISLIDRTPADIPGNEIAVAAPPANSGTPAAAPAATLSETTQPEAAQNIAVESDTKTTTASNATELPASQQQPLVANAEQAAVELIVNSPLDQQDVITPAEPSTPVLAEPEETTNIVPSELPEHLASETATPEAQLAEVELGMFDTTNLEHSRAQDKQIQQLFAQAEQQMEEYYLTQPQGDNAYESYSEILSIDPGNEQALLGIAEISALYASWAKRAESKEDWLKARTYYAKALDLAPNSESLRKDLIRMLEVGKQLVRQ